MGIERYRLGCAMWGLKSWVGELFAPNTKSAEFLAAYASVFNAVEGNTTFYGVPDANSVARWRDATPASFHFCFKFPRRISHELRLVGAAAETRAFLEALAPLGPRLGPFFLQLPPEFDVGSLPALSAYLRSLPPQWRYAVEVRSLTFFRGDAEARLVETLVRHGIDRVVLDARVLHRTVSDDDWIVESKRRKPDMPVRRIAIAANPFLRLIGNDVLADASTCVASWAHIAAGWLDEGRTPYVFLHSPDDFFAPRMCTAFHGALSAWRDVGEMPRWPGMARACRQMTLL
ncbi:MAG: DUF72 domain-containing protein [Myxococcales bacterium FL481]|nr:MAG: DUF72 domain-containing protein [Myxococcales bacterium FL481]